MLDQGHFRYQVGDFNQLVLGVTAGDDNVCVGRFVGKHLHHLLDRFAFGLMRPAVDSHAGTSRGGASRVGLSSRSSQAGSPSS